MSQLENKSQWVGTLLRFFMERGIGPDVTADYCIDLEYLYNMFMVWNCSLIGGKAIGYYNGWTYPSFSNFEDALRRCISVYKISAKLLTKKNGDKYVIGIKLKERAHISYEMTETVIDSEINKLKLLKSKAERYALLAHEHEWDVHLSGE